MASDGKLMISLTTQAKKAMRFSQDDTDPDFDFTIQEGGALPLSIVQTKFKKIDVLVNQGLLLLNCVKFIPPRNEQALITFAGQMVYSAVRLWAGHFMYCPCDQFRHQQLCQAAQSAFEEDEEVEENLTSPPKKALAELIAAFFERSIVVNIFAEAEGEQFTKGITYEHIVNSHHPNLLTTLFFISQIRVAPIAWGPVIELIATPDDEIAKALLPDFFRIVLGIHIVRNGRYDEFIYGQPPHYSDWDNRVYMLAKLLLPYLSQDSNGSLTPPNGVAVGQSQRISSVTSLIMKQMNNPFATANHNSTRTGVQSATRRAGLNRPPVRSYDLEKLDRYYSERATEVVVKAQAASENKQRQPENLEVGFLDSEPAPLSALVSGQINWFRTRITHEDGQSKLRLFRHTDPLQFPLGGDLPGSIGLPHLLLLVDSSSSMGFNPVAPSVAGRGKYDLVLLSCYGIFKYIEDKKLTDRIQVACINFSGRCIESGWHLFSSIDKVKTVLLTYQGGGTTLSPDALRRAFQNRPGDFLAIIITDGAIRNTVEAASELKKIAESDCDLVLLHLGQANAFTRAVEEMNCPVHILNSTKDLVGLSLRIAKERFQCSGP